MVVYKLCPVCFPDAFILFRAYVKDTLHGDMQVGAAQSSFPSKG